AVRAQPRAARVLRAEQLRRYLLAQPAVLAADEVAALVRVLDDARTWQPTSEAGPQLLVAFAGLAGDVRRAARRRSAWVLGLLALTLTGVASLVLPLLGL
ncbi:hypothetical protein, partial [Amnibacterium endophyticum]